MCGSQLRGRGLGGMLDIALDVIGTGLGAILKVGIDVRGTGLGHIRSGIRRQRHWPGAC